MQIVAFEPAHQADVRALILSGLAERWGELDPSFKHDLDDIARSYAAGRMLVAMRRREIVGVGAVLPRRDGTAEIRRVSVAAYERRSGVGALIVDSLLDIARSWGVQRVVCETSSNWTSAVDFYLARGFTLVREVDVPGDPQTHFVYELT